jgi:predicted ATPase
MTETTPVVPPCLARERELTRIENILRDALAGSRSVCFVTGEAGAGKTTLLAEFCRRARKLYPDVIIADGHCDAQTGMGDAYLPFREILTELTGEASRSAASPGSPEADSPRSARFFRLAARTLVEHGPDLVDIFVPGGALMTRLGAQAARATRLGKRLHGAPGGQHSTSGIDQSHICEQYTNVLRQLAQSQPLIVIVDDLHWADNASIDLLFHLARRLVQEHVLIVGSFRPEEVAAGRQRERHPLETATNEIKRYYGDVEIEIAAAENNGLDFINELLDSEPNDLGAGFREALFRHTGGHALFTVELLQDLKEQGTLTRDGAGRWMVSAELRWEDMPPRIEGVIQERLGRLDPSARDVLSVAAVAGDSFAAEVVAAVVGEPVHKVVRTLSGVLARQHRLVQPLEVQRTAGVRLSAYEFRHSIFQKYIYQALDEIERVHIHEHLGQSIEDLFADEADVMALQLARHYAAADEVDKAVRYLIAAARHAYASHAIDDAVGHLRRALELISQGGSPESPGKSLSGERLQIHRLLGAALERKCDYEAARLNLEQALELIGQEERIERANLMCALAKTWERQSDYRAASEVFEGALQVLGEEPPGNPADWWQAWASIRLGQLWLAYWTRDISAMEELIDIVEPGITGHGDALQRRQLWTSRSLLGFRRERFRLSEATLAACDEALAASRETDSLLGQAEACFGAGFARLFSGQSDAAARLLRQAIELAEKVGDLRLQGRALTYLGVACRQTGDLRAVEQTLGPASQAAEASGAHEYVAAIMANQSWLAWRSGNTEDAVRLGRDALAIWSEKAPNYPLQWLAKLPMIAIALQRQDVPGAVELSRGLLPPPNALLGGVTDAMARAVASFDQQEIAQASEALSEAVSLATDSGYL